MTQTRLVAILTILIICAPIASIFPALTIRALPYFGIEELPSFDTIKSGLNIETKPLNEKQILKFPDGTDSLYYIKYNRAYYYEFEIIGADISSFHLLGKFVDGIGRTTRYAADKNHVYEASNVVRYADPNTFKILSTVKPCVGFESEIPCDYMAEDHYYRYWYDRLVDSNK